VRSNLFKLKIPTLNLKVTTLASANKRISFMVIRLKPLVIFVHGSPGSLSAFIDFMTDSILLQSARLISVDRPGFGDANFGYAESSLARQAALLKPVNYGT
jgi:pimeloyl-ACP methyl ester carboxylesterase